MIKKRNYAVDFYRMMFASSFIAIHVFMVYQPVFRGGTMYVWALDMIMPFMVFVGFFMMQGYNSKKKKWAEQGIEPPTAGRQAGNYLKERLFAMFPIFLFGQLLGFVVLNIVVGVPLSQWPLALINGILELLGLQNTGLGLGNAFVGELGAIPPILQLMNAPLWFLSGLWICGYFVYYCIAKWEKTFISLIAPAFSLLFMGSIYMTDINPTWMAFTRIGDIAINAGLIRFFVGISIGCVFWVCIDKIKNKQWSLGMRVFLTIAQTFLGLFAIYQMWTPRNASWAFPIHFGAVNVISLIFTFILLMNVDGFTKVLSRKIWNVPGQLMLYIYIVHFPLILVVGEFLYDIWAIFFVTLAASTLVGFVLYRVNVGLLQPWFRKKPWYSKEQRKLEVEEPKKVESA